jgi:hypothetical protein
MAKIIISYRRSDSDVFAGRVHDQIVSRYGDQSAFIDVDNIPFGKDFRVHIQEELANADAILVIVGPKWLGSKGGRSRIMDAADPVRIEVETALSRGLPTIPILVGNATMPRPEQLPETLKDFPFLNAAQVDTSRDFHRDLNRVIAAIDQILHLPLDKFNEREQANDKQRAGEARAKTTAEIVRQTERDRIASEAEAALRRDDEERRQKAEAEARQPAQRQAEEHLLREKKAERLGLEMRAEETGTQQRTTTLQHFLGSCMLTYSGLSLPFLAAMFFNRLLVAPDIAGAFIFFFAFLVILVAIGAGIGTIGGKQWARSVGCGTCLFLALVLISIVFVMAATGNLSSAAESGLLMIATSLGLIGALLGTGAALYIFGWRSDSPFARAIPKDVTLFAFLLAIVILPFGLLWGAPPSDYANLRTWCGVAIFVTGGIFIWCVMDFRRKFTATSRKSA